MGIISNAQFYTPFVLEYVIGSCFDRCCFDPRLTFYSYRYRCGKPSTAMFRRAARMLNVMGIPVASALYVGNDMLNDILPAKRVGFKTALFAGDRRSLRQRKSDEQCRNIAPDLVVTDLRQLISADINN